MKDYNINNLERIIKSNSAKVVLYGAAELGRLALYTLEKQNIQVDFFCDSQELKQGQLFCNIKIISPQELSQFSSDTHIFICNNYIPYMTSLLEGMKFKNVYNCIALTEKTDYSKASLDIHPLTIDSVLTYHKKQVQRLKDIATKSVNIDHVDIVVTERCSLKCIDCANLMQYYAKPQNCDTDLIFKSVENLMNSIDHLYEFRVIGGDPFVNKNMYEVVNELIKYKNADKVVIYTNAKIVPKRENMLCLKHDKVSVYITSYGDTSAKLGELVTAFDLNNIAYTIDRRLKWTDCGRIQPYQEKTENKLKHMFQNCCNRNINTLLHGKLYRCPFSAHGTNLNAFPFNKDDVVDLSEDKPDFNVLRNNIYTFYNEKDYLTACSYCNGRDYTVGEIDAAIQTKHPLPLPT